MLKQKQTHYRKKNTRKVFAPAHIPQKVVEGKKQWKRDLKSQQNPNSL